MGAMGTAVINYGASPGVNEASVVVTGETLILGTSAAEAFVMAEATADHTAQDHTYLPLLVSLSVGDVLAGTGFTIHSRSNEKLQGTFNLRWVWN